MSALVLILLVALSSDPVQLLSPEVFPAGGLVSAFVLGDFEGDGMLDFVSLSNPSIGSDILTVRLASANGYVRHKVQNSDVGLQGRDLAWRDFDGDGLLDLIFRNSTVGLNPMRRLTLMRTGVTGLPEFPQHKVINFPHWMTPGDFNGDAHLDALTGTTDGVEFFAGNGRGQFAAPVDFPASLPPRAPKVLDFDGDGILDLVQREHETILFSLGNGRGGFPTRVEIPTGGDLRDFDLVDLNRDGHLDIVVSAQTPGAESGELRARLGSGGFSFGSIEVTPLTTVVHEFHASDLDDNGSIDLVISEDCRARVLTSDNRGTFSLGPIFSINPIKIQAADRDGDCLQELFVRSHEAVAVVDQSEPLRFVVPWQREVDVLLRDIAVSDFDGDHLDDYAVPTGNRLDVFWGDANGEPIAVSETQIPGPAKAVGLGDFDQDGDLDLVLSIPASHMLATYLWNDGGEFGSFPVVTPFPTPDELHTEDIDHNGVLDLVVLNGTSPSFVGVVFGKGGGVFSTPVTTPLSMTTISLLADVDGDLHADLCASRYTSSPDVRIYSGLPSGEFQLSTMVRAQFPMALAFGDWNGDGQGDLAVGGFPNDKELTLFFGDALGGFLTGVSFGPELETTDLATGDYDADGIPDLAVASQENNAVVIYSGLGDGTFTEPRRHAVPHRPHTLNPITDSQGQQQALAVVGNFNFTRVDIGPAGIQSFCKIFIRGDCEPDGQIDLVDAIFSLEQLFLGGRRSSCLEACDVNGDGNYDLVDPVILLRFLFEFSRPPADPFPNCDTLPGVECDDNGPCI